MTYDKKFKRNNSPETKMSKSSKKQIILPKLYNCGGDVSGKWHIFYSYIDPQTNKMRRFRVCEKMNSFTTLEEKTKAANNLISKYTKRLKNGWSPFDGGEVIYQDNLEYNLVVEKFGILKRGRNKIHVLMSEFLDEKKPPVFKPKTYQKYQSIFRIFSKWLKNQKKEDISPSLFTEDDARAFFKYLLEVRKLSPASYNKNQILLTAFFKFAKKKGKVNNNPILCIEKLKDRSRVAKFYSEKMVTAIVKYLEIHDPQLLIVVKFIYYTFVRPGELRFIKIKDIDFWGNTITIPREVSKNGYEQKVTIPDALLEELIALKWNELPRDYYIFSPGLIPGEKHVSVNYFSRRYRQYMQKMNISDEYELYSWKHTGAAVAIKQGIDAESIRQQMRHHDLKITQIYLSSMIAGETSDFKTKHKKI